MAPYVLGFCLGAFWLPLFVVLYVVKTAFSVGVSDL